ncbi:ankyrin repeat domain-containing protein [Parashewanella curva]|uniref:Ankyrin repeat domain-containing protein n=1 Tax=Parashewanella curva TaxID=2338552 RepID=A0A3L8PRP5_9GAMM|nr:ankyrin repeat domain-containing protein [Parashewanella curva]RLV58055.1 ankyrin repeat domain-containing protein [Parashewanella curva]
MTTELTSSTHSRIPFAPQSESNLQNAELASSQLETEQPYQVSPSMENTTTSLWKVGTGVGVGLLLGGPVGAIYGGAAASGVHLAGRAVQWGVSKVASEHNAKVLSAATEFFVSGFISWGLNKSLIQIGSSMVGGYVASKAVNESLNEETPAVVRQTANLGASIAGSMLGGMAGSHIETVFALDGSGSLPINPQSSSNPEAKAYYAAAGRTLKSVDETQPLNATTNASETYQSQPQHSAQPNLQGATLKPSDFDSLADKLESKLNRPPVTGEEPLGSLPVTETKQQVTSRQLKGVADEYDKGTFGLNLEPVDAKAHIVSKRSCSNCRNLTFGGALWYVSVPNYQTRLCGGVLLSDIPQEFTNYEIIDITVPSSSESFSVESKNCDLRISTLISGHYTQNGQEKVEIVNGFVYVNRQAFIDDTPACCQGGESIRVSTSSGCKFYGISTLLTYNEHACIPISEVADNCHSNKFVVSDQVQQPVHIETFPVGVNNENQALLTADDNVLITSNGSDHIVRWEDFNNTLIQMASGESNKICKGELSGNINLARLTLNDYLTAFNATPQAPQIHTCRNPIRAKTVGSVCRIEDLKAAFANNSQQAVYLDPSVQVVSSSRTEFLEWQVMVNWFNHLPIYWSAGCPYNKLYWRKHDAFETDLDLILDIGNTVSGPKINDCSYGVVQQPFSTNAYDSNYIAERFAQNAPSYSDQGYSIFENQTVAFGNHSVVWKQITSYIPPSIECVDENGSTYSPPAYKGVSYLLESDYLRQLACEPQHPYTPSNPPIPYQFSNLPTNSSSFNALIPNFGGLIVSNTTQNKLVTINDLISEVAKLHPEALCLGAEFPTVNLARINQDILQAAFDSAAVTLACDDSIKVELKGRVVELATLFDLIDEGSSIGLNSTSILYHSGKFSTWDRVSQNIPTSTLNVKECTDRNVTQYQLTEDALLKAFNNAEPVTAISSTNCNDGVLKNLLDANEVLSTAELIGNFTEFAPAFGTIGIKINASQQVEFNGSVIEFTDIVPFLPAKRSCDWVNIKSNEFALKGLTDTELIHAINCYLNSLSIEACARALSTDIPPTSPQISSATHPQGSSQHSQPSPTSGIDRGGNSTGLIVGLTFSGIIAAVGAAGFALLLCLIKRQIFDKQSKLDVEAGRQAGSVPKKNESLPQAVRMSELQSASDVSPSPTAQSASKAIPQAQAQAQATIPPSKENTNLRAPEKVAKPLPSAVPLPPAEVVATTQVTFAIKNLTNQHVSELLSTCAKGELSQLKQLIQSAPSGFNVRLLLEHKPSGDKVSLLHIACAAGKGEIVEYLIGLNANVNSISYNGFTPLYLAVWNNQTEVVKQLLKANADANIKSNDKTPLELAVEQNSQGIIEVLKGKQPEVAQ